MANILNLDSLEISGQMQNAEQEPKRKKKKKKKMPKVPIAQKQNLTLKEAAAYSGIGINRLRSLTDEKGCKFVLFVGTKRLIKRQLFDEFIMTVSVV